jgi:DNA invertase Pin-like site-specific DNA recombinase
MIYAYVRVSTDKQTTENQRYEILNFADRKHLKINDWVHETISSSKRLQERTLFVLLKKLQSGDTLVVSELSRLGRSLMEVMSMLHHLMDKQVNVLAVWDCSKISSA